MPTPPFTALLAGGTGLVGSHLLELLLKDQNYNKVIFLTRREIGRKDPKLKEVITDFNNLAEHARELKADHVFCCLGATIKKAGSEDKFYEIDHDYPLRLAEISLQQGATHYLLVSALGADAKSMIFYNRVKGEVERDISALAWHALHIFRPSLLLGQRDEKRVGESVARMISASLPFLFMGPLKKYSPTEAEDVANAMMKAAYKSKSGIFVHETEEIKRMAAEV